MYLSRSAPLPAHGPAAPSRSARTRHLVARNLLGSRFSYSALRLVSFQLPGRRAGWGQSPRSATAPGAEFVIGRAVGVLGVAERRLDLAVPESLADGLQAYAIVDEFGGMCMPQL